MLAIYSLWHREMVRFFRQRNRVFGAIGQPIIFWILFGAGLGASFRPGGTGGYLEYFFPGTLALILLFTAIFSTISLIEDRKEGFLQSVLVAPIPRVSLVLGKVLGGTSLAVLQGLMFYLLGPTIGLPLTISSMLAVTAVLTLIAFGLTCVGFCIAWRMDSTQGFHAIMSVFLMPMWLLSGAFFPAEGAPAWLAWIIRLNPLTYGVAALRRILYLQSGLEPTGIPPLWPSIGVTVVAGLLTFGLAVKLAQGRTVGGGS